MPQLRLQHKQWLAGAMIAACCLTLGGAYFSQSLNAFWRTSSSLKEAERFNAVVSALNAISVERGPASLAMTSHLRERERHNLALSLRQDTDRLLGVAERALVGSQDEAELLWSLTETRSRLARARGLIDEVLATEPDNRTDTSITAAISAMFMPLDSGEFARDRLGQTVAALEPALSSEVYLAIAASSLRDQAGRLGAFTLLALRAGAEIDEERDHRVYAIVGRLWGIRENIRNFSVAARSDPYLDSVIWQIDNEFYSVTVPRIVLIYNQARTANALTPAAFGNVIREDIKKVQHLRETIEAWSYGKLDALRSSARTGILLSAALTAFGVFIVIAMTLALRRFLFLPLMMAREQIAALTKGDLSDPQSMNQQSPEMQEMFQGLNNLRDEQRFRRQLEDDQRLMAERLRQLSETDMLTGLPNRRAFEDAAEARLQRADATGESIGIVLFDIDHFKLINDGRGHAAGDSVLHAVASGLALSLPPEALLARFGGEEFVVLLTGQDAVEAVDVAQRLLATLRRLDFPEVPGLRVTASFGVATRHGTEKIDMTSLLTIADGRLYAAKRAGRDQVCGVDDVDDIPAALSSRA